MVELSFFQVIKIISSIFCKLIYMSIKASIFGIFLLLVLKIFNKYIRPKEKYIIFSSLLILLIFPISISSNFSIMPNRIEQIENNVEDDIQNCIDKLKVDNVNKYFKLTNSINKNVNDSISFKMILSFVWFIIVSIVLIIYIICYELFNKKINNRFINDKNFIKIFNKCKNDLKINNDIKVVNQDLIGVPSLFGIHNPKIIFNKNINILTDKELEHVLSHELIHYKRKDNLVNLIIITLKVLYFFNPIIWFLLEKLKMYMEMAVDYEVTKNYMDEDKKLYCKTLVKLTDESSNLFFAKEVSLSDNKRILNSRIKMIKQDFVNNYKCIFIVVFLVLFGIFCICLKENYKLYDVKKLMEYGLSNYENYVFDNVNKVYTKNIDIEDKENLLIERDNLIKDDISISVIDYRLILSSHLDMLDNLNENDLQYNYICKQKYDDKKCIVFSVFSNKNNNYIEWRYWIELKTGFVLKEEYYNDLDTDVPIFKIEYKYKNKN